MGRQRKMTSLYSVGAIVCMLPAVQPPFILVDWIHYRTLWLFRPRHWTHSLLFFYLLSSNSQCVYPCMHSPLCSLCCAQFLYLLINIYVVFYLSLDCHCHDSVSSFEARTGTFLLLNALLWNSCSTAIGSKIVEGSFGMKVTHRKTNILSHQAYYFYSTSRCRRYAFSYKH